MCGLVIVEGEFCSTLCEKAFDREVIEAFKSAVRKGAVKSRIPKLYYTS
jgi:hypothetical protein